MAVIPPNPCLECESIFPMKVDRSKDVREKGSDDSSREGVRWVRGFAYFHFDK